MEAWALGLAGSPWVLAVMYLFAAIDGLAGGPAAWPVDPEGVRYFILRRFPYTIHYEVAASMVTVLAAAHQRRRPGYWQER